MLNTRVIFAVAIAFRLLLLPQTPWLSNDIYRYLWDAHLLQHGVNPYRYPPQAPELEALRAAEIYSVLSHKHVHTVYPPLLQLLFWSGKSLGERFGLGGLAGIKLVFVLLDLLLVAALIKLLPRFQLDARWAILYAWHPLPIIEIAGNGHSDGVGVFCLVLALAALQKNRWRCGAVFLALATLVKFIGILLLPLLFLMKERRRAAWQAVAIFLLVFCASYLPFLAAGKDLVSGLMMYSAKWRFNGGIFSLFFAPVHALLPDSMVTFFLVPRGWDLTAEVLTTRRIDLALLVTKTAMAVLFLYVYFRVWRHVSQMIKQGHPLPWAGAGLILLAGFFLLSPTLHPWYLLWILPLLCLTVPQALRQALLPKTANAAAPTAPAALPQKYGVQFWLSLALLTITRAPLLKTKSPCRGMGLRFMQRFRINRDTCATARAVSDGAGAAALFP